MICPNCGFDNLPGNEMCTNCRQDLTPLDRPTACNRVERSLMQDIVRALPPKPPVTIPATTTVREAIALMLDRNIGAVLVVDEAGQLQGIFSERDLLRKVADSYESSGELPVSQFMSPRPVTVSAGDTLNFVLQKMDGGGYRHLPVVDAGKPISVVSVRDMLCYITKLCEPS